MPTAADREELTRLAFVDELTGLYNRRYFNRYLAEQVAWKADPPPTFSALMIDVDHFKQVNDQHGHAVGDTVLKLVAQAMRDGARPEDVLIRYAGDEFTVLLPGGDGATAQAVGEKLRALVAGAAFRPPEGGEPLRLSLSIGAATFPADAAGSEELLEAADQALYVSKRLGRNRVTHIARADAGFLREFEVQRAIPCKRLVGREAELTALEGALAEVAAGRSLVVRVRGGRGAGKSRLLAELGRRTPSALKLACSCRGSERPLGPIYGALEQHLKSSPDDLERVGRALFDGLRAALTDVVPALGRIPVRRGREWWRTRDEKQSYAFEGAIQALVELSVPRPVVLVLDDAQEADAVTVQAVRLLLRLPRGRVLALTAEPPAPHHDSARALALEVASPFEMLESADGVRALDLPPLAPEHVSEMLSVMLPNRPFTPELDLALVEGSGGNPLFVEETVRKLLLERKAHKQGRTWEITCAGRGDLPVGLAGALEARRAAPAAAWTGSGAR